MGGGVVRFFFFFYYYLTATILYSIKEQVKCVLVVNWSKRLSSIHITRTNKKKNLPYSTAESIMLFSTLESKTCNTERIITRETKWLTFFFFFLVIFDGQSNQSLKHKWGKTIFHSFPIPFKFAQKYINKNSIKKTYFYYPWNVKKQQT